MKNTLLVLAFLLFSSSVSAIDRNRKGFMFGIGGGLAPFTKISKEIDCNGKPTKLSVTREGAAFNFLLGYGWNESNALVLELHLSSIEKRADDLRCPGPPCTDCYYFSISISINQSWSASFIGPVWYHYYGPKKKSLVTIFGLGWQSISGAVGVVESFKRTDEGLGIIAGVGYEMSKAWVIQGRLNIGSSNSGYVNSRSLSILMSKMWY